MLNDRKATELISKSLHGQADAEEVAQVEEHLKSNPQTEAFARLSHAIQNSIAAHAGGSDDVETPANQLSEEAKSRLRNSVQAAMANEDSGAGTTANPIDTNYLLDPQLRETKGRFTLLRKLAEGGLGTVWLARDEKLRRSVAIKEMNAEALTSPKAWQRFQREAEITGHLEHPNVVPLYQFGEKSDNGQPFYVMRFVGKRTLADAILEHHERRRAGSDEEIELHRLLVVFLRVCQAIAYVHSRGVIHRDLKPENIAIDSFGQVVVLDWGLATFVDAGELGARLELLGSSDDLMPARTMDGEVVGTPLYMSPEQAAGDLDRIDERTDVYGLGAILFAILTGCAPHERSNTSTDGNLRIKELLRAIATNEAPVARDFNAEVARDLDSICRKAMATSRHARHASASELADEIERWIAGRRERPRQYDALRLEGRELRANVQSVVTDLGKNVRFMASLPPVQALVAIHTRSVEDDTAVWRDRLATIYQGLLRTNADFLAVSFCRVVDNVATEIVRVERHSTDPYNIRTVPSSRLASVEVNTFVDSAMRQKPDEVFTALCGDAARQPRKVVAAVPVFDEETEEPFGFVLIECGLVALVESHLSVKTQVATEVILSDSSSGVWLRIGGSSTPEEGEFDLTELQPCLAVAERNGEYVDETNLEVYATRVELVPRQSYLTLLVRARTSAR